ncbi:hypothetical protein IQ06DRAFT_11013 [Phaeosphaeriaceae sp. SRC1lsM3a]|nr:hypothetical protein IQ06DRAFT_11013 [Stagonospora sp. SRC1lsM3a]
MKLSEKIVLGTISHCILVSCYCPVVDALRICRRPSGPGGGAGASSKPKSSVSLERLDHTTETALSKEHASPDKPFYMSAIAVHADRFVHDIFLSLLASLRFYVEFCPSMNRAAALDTIKASICVH